MMKRTSANILAPLLHEIFSVENGQLFHM